MQNSKAPDTPMPRLANARMYSATPSIKAAWRQLLEWSLARAQLPWQVIDHDAPAPLAALWAREDLGLAMMCGLPFAQRTPRPTLIAAPIPSPPRYGGKPVYFTDIVVRSDASYRSLEDTFGGVVGYTVADSLSGAVVLRHHLRPYRSARRPRLYRAAVGNLLNARGVIEALAAGRIDVGPLDSYYHDLLRHDDPAFTGQVRAIASTAPLPIPALVATAPLAPGEPVRLRNALLAAAAAPELARVMGRLLLSGFAVPAPDEYQPLAALAGAASIPLEQL